MTNGAPARNAAGAVYAAMSHPQRRLSFRSHHLFAVDRDNLFRMQETDRQRRPSGLAHPARATKWGRTLGTTRS